MSKENSYTKGLLIYSADVIKLETIKEFENGIWRVPKDEKPSFWDKLYGIKITYEKIIFMKG